MRVNDKITLITTNDQIYSGIITSIEGENIKFSYDNVNISMFWKSIKAFRIIRRRFNG